MVHRLIFTLPPVPLPHWISICGPSLVLDYEWNVHEDLCRSDHFPVILTSNAVEEEAAPNRWNFKKADWLSFQVQCTSELMEEAVMSVEDPASQFTDLLIKAANKAIPKTRFSKKLPKVPWFSDSCKRATKERKKAQRKFFSNPTLSNVQNFKNQGSSCQTTKKGTRGGISVIS